MSRYTARIETLNEPKNVSHTDIAYGLDAPTGGFYYDIWKPGSNRERSADVGELGLTLTELKAQVEEKLGLPFFNEFLLDILIKDFIQCEVPTPLQFQMNKMMGIDLKSRLTRVLHDMDNFMKIVDETESEE